MKSSRFTNLRLAINRGLATSQPDDSNRQSRSMSPWWISSAGTFRPVSPVSGLWMRRSSRSPPNPSGTSSRLGKSGGLVRSGDSGTPLTTGLDSSSTRPSRTRTYEDGLAFRRTAINTRRDRAPVSQTTSWSTEDSQKGLLDTSQGPATSPHPDHRRVPGWRIRVGGDQEDVHCRIV